MNKDFLNFFLFPYKLLNYLNKYCIKKNLEFYVGMRKDLLPDPSLIFVNVKTMTSECDVLLIIILCVNSKHVLINNYIVHGSFSTKQNNNNKMNSHVKQ